MYPGSMLTARVVNGVVTAAGVRPGKMFGMPSVFLGGKSVAGLYGDDMVFKLGPIALEKALKLQGVRLFDPAGGRPMKAWAQVPPAHSRRWAEFARSAVEAAEGQAARAE